MNRNDIVFIAYTIAGMPSHAASLRTQRRSCANAFAHALDNSDLPFHFDRAQFFKDCDLGRGTPDEVTL